MSKPKAVYSNDFYIGKIKPVRVLFNPALAEARKIGGKGDAKFEVQIGLEADHPDLLPLKKEMARIARERWGQDTDLKKLQLKFVNGDDEYDYCANKMEPADKRKEYPQLKGLQIMKLRSKNPISVFDVRQRNEKGVPVEITDAETIRRVIYAGSYVSMKLTLATYDEISDRDPNKARPPGVTVYPEQICFVADGERLTSGGNSDGSGFAAVQGAVSAEDPTGDSDDPLAGL